MINYIVPVVMLSVLALLCWIFTGPEICARIVCMKNGWKFHSVRRPGNDVMFYGIDRGGQWHYIG